MTLNPTPLEILPGALLSVIVYLWAKYGKRLMDKSFKNGRINWRAILLHEIGFEKRFVQIVLEV